MSAGEVAGGSLVMKNRPEGKRRRGGDGGRGEEAAAASFCFLVASARERAVSSCFCFKRRSRAARALRCSSGRAPLGK